MEDFTPGPWHVGKMFADRGINGFPISGRGLAIARVWAGSVNYPLAESMHDIGTANARLIAAAPELLTVLKAITVSHEALERERGSIRAGHTAIARAVIAKVEGR